MSNDSFQSFDQAEALALLDRLFGPSSPSTSSSPTDGANWRDTHHHRSSSLSSTSSTDSYWQGQFLSVPDTPIDRNEEYPFDLREPPQPAAPAEYKGPRITVSPVNVQMTTSYLSRGGRPKTADKPARNEELSSSNSVPSIAVEFAE